MLNSKCRRIRFNPECMDNKCDNDGFSLFLTMGTTILTLGFVILLCIPFFFTDLLNQEVTPTNNKDISLDSKAINDILPVSFMEPEGMEGTVYIDQPDVQGIVMHIIDGDTIIVSIPDFPPIVGNRIAVRLSECDISEDSESDPVIKQLTESSRKALFELTPPGSVVWLRDIKRDKDFRLLAKVEVGGMDVAKEMNARSLLGNSYDEKNKIVFPVESIMLEAIN